MTCTVCGFVDKVNYTDMAEHDYKEAYITNASFHWLACKNCDATEGYGEHTADDNGICTVCEEPLAPTIGIVYDISADGTYAEVIGYTGTATKILIAETYEGLPVKVIYDEAFRNNDTIKQVVIPDSVETIGSYAFASCSSLTSVTIENDAVVIGENAFSYCHSSLYTEYELGRYVKANENPYAILIEVTNKNLSTYKLHEDTKIIARSAFGDCARMTSIAIPDGVKAISYSAFYGCSALTSVTIPDSVTSIGGSAFSNCSFLTSIYYKGDAADWNAISIGDYNENLTSATRYYYSEEAPTEAGNYWHYDADGKVAVWEN